MKRKLYSDGQQYQQFTNNLLSPSPTEHKTETTTYDVGNPGPGLEQTHKSGGVSYWCPRINL